MAKRSRPDPIITERWVSRLTVLSQELTRRRKRVEVTEKEFGDAIRGAFSEGVLVGPLKQVTGLSGSRLYQLKFEHRGDPSKSKAESNSA